MSHVKYSPYTAAEDSILLIPPSPLLRFQTKLVGIDHTVATVLLFATLGGRQLVELLSNVGTERSQAPVPRMYASSSAPYPRYSSSIITESMCHAANLQQDPKGSLMRICKGMTEQPPSGRACETKR